MSNKGLSKAIKIDRVIIISLPIIIGIISFFLTKHYSNINSFTVTCADGFENCKMMVGIWGTLLGFLITAVSILLTLGENRFVKMLKDSNHYETILFAYVITCIHLLISIVISVAWIFMKIWSSNVFYALVALSVDTMLLVGICLYFLFSLILKVNSIES